MDADDSTEQSLAHAEGGLVAVLLIAIGVLVCDVEGLGPLVPVVVVGCYLERAPVRHDGVNRIGVPSPGEGVPDGSLADDRREAQLMEEPLDDPRVLVYLGIRARLVGMCGVGLEEVYLPDPYEGPRLLRLVPEGVHDLERLEGQVGVGPDPQREHGVHRGLARWTQEHGDVQLVLAGMADPIDLLLESLDLLVQPELRGVYPLLPSHLESLNELVLLLQQVVWYE